MVVISEVKIFGKKGKEKERITRSWMNESLHRVLIRETKTSRQPTEDVSASAGMKALLKWIFKWGFKWCV